MAVIEMLRACSANSLVGLPRGRLAGSILLVPVLLFATGLGTSPRFYLAPSTGTTAGPETVACDAIALELERRGGRIGPAGESEAESVRRAAALGVPAFRLEWTPTSPAASASDGSIRLVALPSGRVVAEAELSLRDGIGAAAARRMALPVVDWFLRGIGRN